MNGFVPALVAVLLAEFGQRGALSFKGWQNAAAWAAIAAMLFAASTAGQLIAPRMSDEAGALMIGVALALAAAGQLFKAKAAETVPGGLWRFWSGGAPLIAFAFAVRFGLYASALGTLGGVVVAGAATSIAFDRAAPMRILRGVGAVGLLAIAAVVAVNALRLV